MRRIFITLLTLAILTAPATALAQPDEQDAAPTFLALKVKSLDTPEILLPKQKPVETTKPEPVVYTVLEGDNLTKIGSAHNVEWQRIWAKNTQLTHPDILKVGDKLTIPLPDEQLSRELPAAVSLPAETPGVITPSRVIVAPGRTYDGGNSYDYGYCTWYVKNRRGSSLPNNLGNANAWYYNAQAQGMAVGAVPRPGAVGTTSRGSLGHVVYVESVNGDGTINISEMNYQGFGVVSRRTTSANEFMYIY